MKFETSGRLLVINKPDKFENNWLRFETSRTLPITDEPDEFEKQSVEVHDVREITDHFRGNSRER